MKLADWINILYTYGPFAFVILLLFPVERKLRKLKKEASQEPKTSDSEKRNLGRLYMANWMVIFGLVFCCVVAWKLVNLDRRPQINGTIESVSDSEVLSSGGFEELYLHRIPQNNSRYVNYQWLLMKNQQRVDDGEVIVFTIDRSTTNSEVIYDYELPIRPAYYNSNVVVRLRRDNDDLYLTGQEKPLTRRSRPIGVPSVSASQLASPWDFFIPTVYAQTSQGPSSINDLAIALESPDALVRRKARADLANQDQAAALSLIDKVLQDPKVSYRTRLGVLVALANMPNLRGESLRQSTITAIQNSLADSDETLRGEAFILANRYDLIPVTVYEDINYSGRSQGFGPGVYRSDQHQLGSLPNDSASAVRVAKGFRVRLCDNEGAGNGSGKCEERGEGWHQLRPAPFGVADQVSYIEVRAAVK